MNYQYSMDVTEVEESNRIEMLEKLFHKNNLAWSHGVYSEYLEFLKTYIPEEGTTVNRYTRMMAFIEENRNLELEEKDVAPEDRAHLLQMPISIISIMLGPWAEGEEDYLLMYIEMKPYTKMSEIQALSILDTANNMMESFYDPKLQRLLLKPYHRILQSVFKGVGTVMFDNDITSNTSIERREHQLHRDCYYRKDELNMYITINNIKTHEADFIDINRQGQCDSLLPSLCKFGLLEDVPIVEVSLVVEMESLSIRDENMDENKMDE